MAESTVTLSARMLTSSASQWPAGQNGRLMSRAFTIFTKLVMTCKINSNKQQIKVRVVGIFIPVQYVNNKKNVILYCPVLKTGSCTVL